MPLRSTIDIIDYNGKQKKRNREKRQRIDLSKKKKTHVTSISFSSSCWVSWLYINILLYNSLISIVFLFFFFYVSFSLLFPSCAQFYWKDRRNINTIQNKKWTSLAHALMINQPFNATNFICIFVLFSRKC